MNIRARARTCRLRLGYVVLALAATFASGVVKGGTGGPIPPPQFWQSLFKLGTFTSDGVTPVVITIPAEYYDVTVFDDPTGGGGPPEDQVVAPSIRGPGVLIYPTGTAPPFANSWPPLHTNAAGYVVADNTAADWNPALAAATAGPYWPSEWRRGGIGGPGGATVGHVTVAVLPAGTYDAWAEFGTGSIGASVGPAERFPYLFLGSPVSYTGNVPAPSSVPTVGVFTSKATATKGKGDQLQFTFQRIDPSGDYSKPLTVYYRVTGSAPTSDYTFGGTSPISFPAGAQTATLTVTPINNGVYDSGVTVVVNVQPDHATPATYSDNTASAVGTILSANRAPVVEWTTSGIYLYSGSDEYSITINQGDTIDISTRAFLSGRTMNRSASIREARASRAFTIVELLVGTAIVMMLAISATSLLTIITRRVNNDHTRYTLALSNARTAHIISELARRSTRVWVYTTIADAAAGASPASAGDVIAFTLPDGTSRYIAFEDTAINFYADPSDTPLLLAGGSPGMIAARVGTDAHCSFTQGLPRVGWLAEAQTTRGWTEQITYSAWAVALHNR